jgi:hypothetical protein
LPLLDESRSAFAAGAGGRRPTTQEAIMGKYVLAWILGVPAVVLVIVYLLFG